MMKLGCFIFLMFLSLCASAQQRDTVSRDTATPGVILDADMTTPHAAPLILVDGIVYKGDLKAILPDNITEVNVVRDTSYIKLYGKAAQNGIIFITTRGHKNIYKYISRDSIYRASLPDSAMYVIDGELSAKKPDGIDSNDILSVNVLNQDQTSQLSESGVGRTMVVVVTKRGATKSYQWKFSAFSPAYKEYLDKHNADDSNVYFRIDGKSCDKSNSGIQELYKVPKDKISKVKLSGAKDGITIVDITTKK